MSPAPAAFRRAPSEARLRRAVAIGRAEPALAAEAREGLRAAVRGLRAVAKQAPPPATLGAKTDGIEDAIKKALGAVDTLTDPKALKAFLAAPTEAAAVELVAPVVNVLALRA